MSIRSKTLGQNFLKDPTVIHGIIEEFKSEWQAAGHPPVLEIGPGEGALTEKLLPLVTEHKTHLNIIEMDHKLAEYWTTQQSPQLSIQHGDFLDLNVEQWKTAKQLFVVSNLPYSASTLIFLALTRAELMHGGIPSMLLMFQAEVAQKIRAPEESSERAILSVLGQNVWEIRRALKVPPSAFRPAPKIDSEVLLFKKKTKPEVEDSGSQEKASLWEKLVRTAFRQKRKMLRSNFKGDAALMKALEQSGVENTLRAEALKWKDWNLLFKALKLPTLVLVMANLLALNANANIGDTFGFGSRAASLGGATVSGGADGYSAYSNPGLLSLPSSQRIQVSYGVLYMQPEFEPIERVLTENTTTSDRPTYASVPVDYPSTLGQELGITAHIAPEFMNLSAGLVTYFPLSTIGTLDSGDPFLPEYVLYRSRTQRPQIDFSVGAELSKWLSFGAGVHFAFAVNSEATMILQTAADKISSMRVRTEMKPKVGPYFGIHLAPPPVMTAHPDWGLGLVVRLPVSSPTYFEISTGTRAIGGTAIVDFNLSATSVAQYDPLALEVGGNLKTGPRGRFFWQVEYQRWEAYEKPAVEIEACKTRPCSINLQSSGNPHQPFRDIIVPKAGEEWDLSPTTAFRVGYSYRPSPLRDSYTGSSNYLDPPKHIFGAGLGFKFQTLLGAKAPNHLDFHLSYHLLEEQKINKSSSSDIGAPGYTAGGKIYGGGLTLTVEI